MQILLENQVYRPIDGVIHIQKKGDLNNFSNYLTISPIYISKIVLRIILDRFIPQADEILMDEQAALEKTVAQRNTF